MIEKVITDNASERLVLKWDGERFALVKIFVTPPPSYQDIPMTTILSPSEMATICIEVLKIFQEERVHVRKL